MSQQDSAAVGIEMTETKTTGGAEKKETIKKKNWDELVIPIATLEGETDTDFNKKTPEEFNKLITEANTAFANLREALDGIQSMDDMSCFFKQPTWLSYVGGIVAAGLAIAATVFAVINFSMPGSIVIIGAAMLMLITIGILLSKVDKYAKALDPFTRVKRLYDVIDKTTRLQMLGLRQLFISSSQLKETAAELEETNTELQATASDLETTAKAFKVERDEYKTNNETLKATASKLEKERGEFQKAVLGLRATIGTLTDNIGKTDEIFDINNKEFMANCFKLADLTTRNEALTEEREELQEKMAESLSDMQEMIRELSDYQSKEGIIRTIEENQSDIDDYSQALIDAAKLLPQFKNTLLKLKGVLDMLKKALDPNKSPKSPEAEERMTLRTTHMRALANVCTEHATAHAHGGGAGYPP